MQPSRPNIVMIVMDTARAASFSCYGNDWRTSPRIDRLAEQGVLYSNAASASPWTLPSHATLFTGRYPSQHGCTRISYELAPGFPTLAGLLQQNGYHTISVARNPMLSRQTGILQGFKEAYCLDQFFAQEELIRDMLGDYEAFGGLEKIRRLHRGLSKGSYPKNLVNYLYNLAAGRSRRFRSGRYFQKRSGTINRLAKKAMRSSQRQGQPFFLFVNYMEHHLPYIPPASTYRDRHPDRVPDQFTETVKRELPLYNFGHKELDEATRRALWATYHGATRTMDDQVADLHGFLEQSGLLENTMFILTSDHGENLGEHGMLDHRYCLFDTLLKVPLILQYPQGEYAGTVVEDRVQLNDILPTVLEVAGLAESAQWDGSGQDETFTLLPDILRDRPREYAAAEYIGTYKLARAMTSHFPQISNLELRNADLKCLYKGPYKYVLSSTGQELLFDLVQDPEEVKPLEMTDLQAEMQKVLLDRLGGFPEVQDTQSRLEQAVAWKLKTLGYM